ncbi:sigma-70 family RNA polymerase sigma factor [Amphritea sp. 2_MG-2023]|jgi:RNA polymerase sigma factor (sigma-70 family)|uniref:response regulator transcription factor n=1 Tax=Amphritea TaxID=515417 RepID=UPI001C076E0C|nr:MULTISPECIES: sigma-70 family RNA polymerase sigma factor [Amphritea]MBU2966337.1 sigma-70 family RNA polymerase sigma factor [Amphritea atlantica]MDO6419776.1 sigma-70 family RNA polymerase sigma factor [Amphritea sp. 2_MG-2023]MDX2421417.1 sigma-70 family RNA polymerase sigma factor [Amphritea sp.]
MSKYNGTVFIVDDDDDFRDSMQWLLESDDLPVKSFSSARDFLNNYKGDQGCMLLDVRMPEINGLALQQIMLERDIRLPIIVLSGHGDIPMAVTAMKNGAIDFLEKPFDDEVLIPLVQNALKKSDEILAAQQQREQIHQLYETLSRREREVMALVVSGKANREIAEELGISPKTVEVHRSRVMSKMRAESLPVLVNQAAQLES